MRLRTPQPSTATYHPRVPDEAHPFAGMAGVWQGRGEGSYPNVAPFAYLEELVIEPVPGRPVAHWRSRSRDAATGEPRHAEAGFVRAGGGGVELVVAHNTGITEVAVGTWQGGRLRLSCLRLLATPTAKQVDRVDRAYDFTATGVTYGLEMAAVGVPLTHHLHAVLLPA
jgi:hypothetical protein